MSGSDPASPGDGDPWKARPFLAGSLGGVPEPVAQPGSAVRPFLVTQGRTTGLSNIALEAQVLVTRHGMDVRDTLTFEYRDIVSLVEEPLAVAEIAARLKLHLGVIRVLLGDLQQRGMVTTFEAGADLANDVDTIQRVIDELRQRS